MKSIVKEIVGKNPFAGGRKVAVTIDYINFKNEVL